MSQRPIDLLPPEIHAQNAAGLVIARHVTAIVIVAAVLVITITHSQLMKERGRQSLRLVMSQADLVQAAEIKESQLKSQLARAKTIIEQYRVMAPPLDVSAILATVINLLPESVTLERIEIDSSERRSGRTARTSMERSRQEAVPRVLTGELSGFAASDQDIAGLVALMKRTPPLENVSLDFTRSRVVRERSAREFRVSFRVDLDRTYEVADAPASLRARPFMEQQDAPAGLRACPSIERQDAAGPDVALQPEGSVRP